MPLTILDVSLSSNEKGLRLLHVDIVTPRNSNHFLRRIGDLDPSIDHLCLELVHWTFEGAMAWIWKVGSLCDHTHKSMLPAISVHGFDDDLNDDQVNAILRSNAIWMPRTEGRDRGKDCATIVHEMLACRKTPRKQYVDPDIETYCEASTLVKSEDLRAMPDEEFAALIDRTMKEIHN